MDNIINNSIVYYINLDERKDRDEHILNELKQVFPENIINRISATKNINGAIGCTQSHINTIFKFIKSNKDICFVFEDDFKFLFPIDDIHNMLSNALQTDFNVIMMSYNGLGLEIDVNTIKNNVCKSINKGRTTAGYIVHKKFAKTLLDNYLSGVQQLIETGDKQLYAIDMFWFSLQNQENKFYVMMPCIGTQLSGYSSIEQQNRDYVQCNTCIILTDYDINKDIPFLNLKYNYIDDKTIKNIKNKYKHIKYLMRLTEELGRKLDWQIINNIYKDVVYKNMTKQFKFPHFNITINNFMLNISEIEKIDYDDNFIVILN